VSTEPGAGQNARCAARSIEQKNSGEQVDLVILLGNLLLVGEIKCLLYPIEPIEHFNYLRKLDDAGMQATRKARWLKENPAVVAMELELPLDSVNSLRLVPLVITNQGAGFGLEVHGARVVDSHFLKLYLTDGEYVSGLIFDAEKEVAIPKAETLYRNEIEAATKFEATIANPPPLRRLMLSATWKDNRFPSSDGQDLFVANCYQDDSIIQEAKERAIALGFKPPGRRKRS